VFAHSNGDTELPLPDYVKYVEMFVKEHYDDIKSAFSIFERLENIYRLLGCVSLVNKIQSKADLSVSIKATSLNLWPLIDRYPHSIMCSGGLLAAPCHFI